MIDNADIIEQTGALQKLSDADSLTPINDFLPIIDYSHLSN